jgi:hypothetical protein
MKYITKGIALFFCLGIIRMGAEAQVLPDSMVKRINYLFKEWNTSTSPGCTIAIVR